MSKVNEALASQIIRKFSGLEQRPEISDEVDSVVKKSMEKDDTRKSDDKVTDLADKKVK